MLLVILGAGASYDCMRAEYVNSRGEAVAPPPPPQASQLFAPHFGPVIDRYPPARAIAHLMRGVAAQGTTSIEHEFERIVGEARDSEIIRRQLAAVRFYLHDVIEESTQGYAMEAGHGVTNYHALVDRIERLVARGEHPVLYVTFNYDTLLERAISDTVIQGFPAINAYISYQRRTLIKLHGSVNWRRKTDGLLAPLSGGQPQQNAEWLMDRFENIRLTREYEVGLWHQFIIRQPVFLPAIAVPTEHKAIGDFELPEEHLNALRELLPRVDQVLVIGWRGHEDHFWELWHECRPQPATMNVVVVAENQQAAGEVAGHLHGMGMSTRVEAAQARGFTGYLAEGGLPGLFLP